MFLNIQVFKGVFRWKFLWATNNISYASLLPSFCNWMSGFRARKMVVHANDPGCLNSGLRTESRRSTSTSLRTIPESSWLWICAEHQDVNWSFINFFASLLTVKSRGCKKWVIFAGTLTTSIFSDAKVTVADSKYRRSPRIQGRWPWNSCHCLHRNRLHLEKCFSVGKVQETCEWE